MRAPGVPAPTWLGWTLGAAFAQVAARPGSSLGLPRAPARRRRRAATSRAGDAVDGRGAGTVGGERTGGGALLSSVVVGCARLLTPAVCFATLLGCARPRRHPPRAMRLT
jgi:hypothetical protein